MTAAIVPRVAVITGASSGIGEELARQLARKGYRLVLSARRADRLDALAQELGVETLVIPAALEDSETPERVITETLAKFGRIDVLINNAGLGLPTLFADAPPDELRLQLEVNLIAPVLLARLALPHLSKTRGMIINIGSLITCVANPALGVYGASKAGLAYFTDALRREIRGRGVHICLVEPGPIKTGFFVAMSKLGPNPGTFHPLNVSPAAWMATPLDVAAAQIVGLIDRPKRRLSIPLRVSIPWRLVGGLFTLLPALGDLAVSATIRRFERNAARQSELSSKT